MYYSADSAEPRLAALITQPRSAKILLCVPIVYTYTTYFQIDKILAIYRALYYVAKNKKK